MKIKVIDIFPPTDLEKKETKEILKKEAEPEPERPEIETKKPPVKISWFSVLVLFLVLAGASCFFYLSKANVEIWPKTDTLSLKTKLTIDNEVKEPDFTNKIIPGQIFEKEKGITEKFSASGKALKETKAEGTVKIYNEYSVNPQALIAATRFVSAEGKIFRTPTKITVPGGHYEKGKLIAGEVEIRVVADQVGPEYNIGPTAFSIPGFAGSDKYTKIYAKSSQAMTGGFSQETYQVTKEDLENAKNILSKEVKEECEAAFKTAIETEKVSAGFSFLEDAIQTEIVETFSLAGIGDNVPDFNYQAKAKSGTLLFRKEDFENFVKDFLISQIPEGKQFYEPSLKIDKNPETVNLKSGKIILSLDVSVKIFPVINMPELKKNLQGKSLLESKIFLEEQSGVDKAEVELWPFWVKKVPQNTDKINLNLNID
jgi:hypothetical protein